MKKSIKKLSAIFLAGLLVFSVTACTKKRTAKEVLESSIEKAKDITSSHMTGTAKYKIEAGDSDSSSAMEFDMSFDAKVSDANKDSMKMDMNMKMSILGQSLDMNMYYTDGYYYMNMAGQKQKMKMDIAAMQKQIESTTGQTSLSSKYYKDLKLEEDGDNQVLSYSLSEDGLNEYLESVMSQMESLTGNTSDSNAADSIKISSFSGKRTLDEDDNVLKESIKMVMESKTGEAGKITLSMDISYKDIGKKVKVELPSDLNTYTEIDSTDVQ